ncbi:MAG TPA: hypothetical protein ENG51_07125 [Deltaproteobacteria bacterium]|nr:hypothetical protein [Deltaproteobacteria bacterium]
MVTKILCAVDNSTYSQEALRTLGEWFKNVPGVTFRLIHISPLVKQLRPGEIARVHPDTDYWKKIEVSKCESVLQLSKMILQEAGISSDRIEKVFRVESDNIAEDILDEARANNIGTIAMGRRGMSEVKRFVLGGVSSRIAQEAVGETVWIFDPEIASRKVLIALDGTPQCLNLIDHFTQALVHIPDIAVTMYHVIPPIPATYWDDGHILSPEEQRKRDKEIEQWYASVTERVQKAFNEGKEKLMAAGLSEDQLEFKIERMKRGPARDILDTLEKGEYGILVMGRQSMAKGKPYAIGGRAYKILNAARNCMLCMVP